ncbi:MAG: methylenetetrahydrofolate reductase [NAD(P)H] [Bacteroidetes bacterium GWA2_31_9]|nr:MAG: methylenetetrahydrofolate reductase [NAD(P)H] [Bacteroidetes bacterium GWA2_31_9]
MKVCELFKKSKKPLFTFEILPPLKGVNISTIYDAIEPLMEFDPAYINVTYHQQETVYKKRQDGLLEKKVVSKRPGTVAISAAIKFKYKVEIVPHLICGGFTKEDTEDALIDLHFLGFNNVLALRGDPPKTERFFRPEEGGHKYAIDMVKQIQQMNKGIYLDSDLQNVTKTDFCVGIAAYPEKHAESPNKEIDMKYLKEKVDAGADYIVTQMFFDNNKYYDFVNSCRKEGINIPIIPGIKPITSLNDIKSIPKIFHIDIPYEFMKTIENCKNNKEAAEAGIEWATYQSKELVKFGVPSIHYFTIGYSQNIVRIAKEIF